MFYGLIIFPRTREVKKKAKKPSKRLVLIRMIRELTDWENKSNAAEVISSGVIPFSVQMKE